MKERDPDVMEVVDEVVGEVGDVAPDPRRLARVKIDPDQEQIDIEKEMDEDAEEEDSDDDLFIQALRERLQAAAQLHALGEKLPFGFHFDMVAPMPRNVVTYKTGRKEEPDKDDDVDAKPAVKQVAKAKTPVANGKSQRASPFFKCTDKTCNKKFSSWAMMNAHANEHNAAKERRLRKSLKSGEESEEGEISIVNSLAKLPPPSACPICGDKDAVKDLNEHVKKVHKIEGVMCPHCGKILSKACTLNRHIEQVHLNLQIHKPAKCEKCGKIFSKKGHLDRHVRTIHMGIKDSSEPCPFCGKVFSTKSSLEPHIDMVHRGVRKACPECGKVLSDLWKHMRTVHGKYRRRIKIPKDGVDTSIDSGSLDLMTSDSENAEDDENDEVEAPVPVTNNNVEKRTTPRTTPKKKKPLPTLKVKIAFKQSKRK